MPLKEMFVSYVNLQRNANEMKMSFGVEDRRTKESYALAKSQKDKVLREIEELEHRIESLENDN